MEQSRRRSLVLRNPMTIAKAEPRSKGALRGMKRYFTGRRNWGFRETRLRFDKRHISFLKARLYYP